MTVDELRAALPRDDSLEYEAKRNELCKLIVGIATYKPNEPQLPSYMLVAAASGAVGYAVVLGILTLPEQRRLTARFEELLRPQFAALDTDDYCHYCNSPKTPGESHAHCARAGRAQADREDAERAAAEDGEDADE